jgi:uncharacterized protein with HEPN domain
VIRRRRAAPERGVEDRLRDIVEWGETLAMLVAGMTREGFRADLRTRLAVVKCIETIGEAAGQLLRIAPDIEERHPGLDALRAYEARNRMAHGYFDLDYDTVWTTAVRSVPAIVTAARSALEKRETGQTS